MTPDNIFKTFHRHLKRSPRFAPHVERASSFLKDWLFRMDRPTRTSLMQEWKQVHDAGSLLRFSTHHLRAVQKSPEILQFAAAASKVKPRVLCEIGTLWGGTHLFLTHAIPSVNTTIAVDFLVHNKSRLRFLAKRHQQAFFVDGPSSSTKTVSRVNRALAGRQIDLLFIDGDHRYEGARADFLTYRHLVRDGGLIAFHDICEDEDAGFGVPLLWRKLRSSYPYQEYVDSPEQQGFGIGAIIYSHDARLPVDL